MQREAFDVAIDMICFTREDAESNLRAFRGVQHFIQTSTVCTYGVDYDWYPVSEDHPLRPISDYGRNKVAADTAYLGAYHTEGFPVTVIKPSTTHGPQQGLLRQIAAEFSWLDRIRKGKPILVCGDGKAVHQFLHVDDAALAYTGVIGKPDCIGQVYNLVDRGFISWADYHRTAMKVIGREVELVGIPLADLRALNVPKSEICEEIFAYNCYYSAEKLFRDVPEFHPRFSLEAAMAEILNAMDADGRIPNSDEITWEDAIIAAQRQVRKTVI
jgi:nucleoside-diphosphate-sugar epimerase